MCNNRKALGSSLSNITGSSKNFSPRQKFEVERSEQEEWHFDFEFMESIASFRARDPGFIA